jgi:non-specific protein-tyrosine kinase
MSLITLTDPRSPLSEAYRSLRTNLSFYSLDNPLKSLVVTSPTPDEDANTAIANLAVTMAQGGQRTILVDCDMRRPSLAPMFGIASEPGLTNLFLADKMKLTLQKTEVDNLWILPSGPKPPNPADVLGSKQFDKVISALIGQADIVLFAAPPVMSVTDATVLGAKVDGVLLVLNAGKTRRDHAQQAKQRLETANVRIVGATLLNAPTDNSIDNYYG